MRNHSFLFVGLLVVLCACGAPESNQKESTLEKVMRTGVIRVATIPFPPTVIKDPVTGKYSGHMVDAIREIAKRMGVEIEWTETTYGDAAATLQSGRCDLVVAPLFANIERAQKVAFTHPLFYLGLSALVREDSGFENVESVFDFDKPGIRIAFATGEAGDVFASAKFSNAQLTRINVTANELSRFMLEVSIGNADVAIADAEQIRVFVENNGGLIDVFAKRQFDLNPACWAVPYGDSDWLRFIETSLVFLETQGTLRELEDKYDAHWQHQR